MSATVKASFKRFVLDGLPYTLGTLPGQEIANNDQESAYTVAVVQERLCLRVGSLRLFEVGHLAGAYPLRSESKFGDPLFDVRNIEFVSANFYDPCCIFDLSR